MLTRKGLIDVANNINTVNVVKTVKHSMDTIAVSNEWHERKYILEHDFVIYRFHNWTLEISNSGNYEIIDHIDTAHAIVYVNSIYDTNCHKFDIR